MIKNLRIHIIQHLPHEKAGTILEWARANNHQVRISEIFSNGSMPELNDLDWLIIMGGSMSVNDEAKYPWIRDEIRLIQNCASHEKLILGICLGSQMIAKALGSKVYPNTYTEIGWLPVRWNDDALRSALFSDIAFDMDFFHWHGETFDLPKDSVLLASSKGCKHQAFQAGSRILGIQFHPEIDMPLINEFIDHERSELTGIEFIQTESQILDLARDRIGPMKKWMFQLLDRFSNIS